MKTYWKKLMVVVLLLAMAVGPAFADENPAPGNDANNKAIVPPPPPAPPINDRIATNEGTAAARNKDVSEHTPVRIDMSGIHVGGRDPVEISMPSMNGRVMGHADMGIPAGAVLISVVAIITPFLFLALAGVLLVFFKHRRNRMLHDTLRAMIDKGVPIPPELIVPPSTRVTRRSSSDLRAGLVCVGIGLGILLFFHKLGWIAVFVGIAFLITWLVEKKERSQNNEQPSKV